MLEAIWKGFLLGLLLSILIGPVFFLLIKTSIRDGFKNAMVLEAGIFLSDAVCISLSYLGMAQVLTNPTWRIPISYIGGALLLVFGAVTLRSTPTLREPLEVPKRDDFIKLFLKGFFFNISNPSVIFFWIGAVGIAVSEFEGETAHVVGYFTGTLLVVVGIDVLKAWSAHKLSSFINEKRLRLLSRFAGMGIMAFGLVLWAKTWFR
jgi:threonine/homoserine/homoserine lactone efflux protein